MVWRNKQPRAIAGFTLIELLVVISIISLLPSVVFASLSDAREKAQIASIKQKVAGIQHMYGQGVGRVSFDQPSGSTVINGVSFPIQLSGPGVFEYTDEGIYGNAMNFSGNIDQMYINTGTLERVQALSSEKGTYMFWFYYDKEPTVNNLDLLKYGTGFTHYPRIFIGLSTSRGLNIQWPNDISFRVTVEPNKWHHVIFSWISDPIYPGGYHQLYIDGEFVRDGAGPVTAQSETNTSFRLTMSGQENNLMKLDDLYILHEPIFEY
jgi:prepilin-type N-terminal cleavage/methylation domain-containing protein